MKVQHIILVLSDGRKGLFTGKPFVNKSDVESGIMVEDLRFTDAMEMKGFSPVEVEDVEVTQDGDGKKEDGDGKKKTRR